MEKINFLRPEKEINTLCDLIEKNASTIHLAIKAGSLIDNMVLIKKTVILIKSGDATLYKKYDEKFLFNFKAPFLFGMLQYQSQTKNYCINGTLSPEYR